MVCAGYALKAGPVGFADCLEMECERGRQGRLRGFREHLAESPGHLVRWRRLRDTGLGRTQVDLGF